MTIMKKIAVLTVVTRS